ncbi:MAG: hypothetical protein AB1626_03575, partial [Candidatus Micrarchaeota archaeon]
PSTTFSVSHTESGFALGIHHPVSLRQLSPSELTPAVVAKIKAKRKLVRKLGVERKRVHEALYTLRNWATDDRGNVYYTNLHFFIPAEGHRMPKAIRRLTSHAD